ncbi:MAG: serine hydrolase [Microcoleaceae cyanobacterium]
MSSDNLAFCVSEETMHRLLRTSKLLVSSLALGLGIGIFQTLPMLGSSPELYGVNSLDELVALRQQLIQELEAPNHNQTEPSFFASFFNPNKAVSVDEEILAKLKDIEIQIVIEQRANENWQQALQLAERANEKITNSKRTIEEYQQTQALWQRAINNLSEISTESFQAIAASEKIKEYQVSLESASQALLIAKASVLDQIRLESGLSSTAMISICSIQRNCLNLHGDKPPASAASLIKVPVAVALLHKTTQEEINLNQEVYVDSGNFTEDASQIYARQSYPLEELMGEMIDHSSNIATNQLIDYLGQSYINEMLKDEGYQVTRVRFKLMGNRIMPKKPGKGRNSLTSNELTEMMVKTYNHEVPAADALIDALSRQYDQEMGYAALEDLGETVEWLGEKTGQNSRVVGTTLAAKIDGEKYVITVIDNNTGHIPQIRKSIKKIAENIVENGHF